MRILSNIVLSIGFISLLRTAQAYNADSFIAFNKASCTPDILPFMEAEVRNALDLVKQTAAWINPPLYDEIVQSYIKDLFGDIRYFESYSYDPVNFPRNVFATDWPRNLGRGLMGFNTTFVDESQLRNKYDLLIYCAPIQFGLEMISRNSRYPDGSVILTDYYWDTYYNEYQFADLIDRCRGPTATLRAFVGHDFLEMKPDTMTLCPTWLDQARSALFPDTGTINTDDIRSRMSAWNSYLQSKSGYSNLAEIDRFKLINHILVHEFTHTWQALSGISYERNLAFSLLASSLDRDIADFGYGWAQCRTLSDKRGLEAPERNADSYTYLTIAIDLLVNMQSLVTSAGAVLGADD